MSKSSTRSIKCISISMIECVEANFYINIPSYFADKLEICCCTPKAKGPPNISINQGSTHLPAVPGHPGAPGYPPGAPAVEGAAPLPAQPGAYHMAYPYPHPGYYPPHPAYPPTTPGVSQSKHQSQL